jgi:hypothetical protein
MVDVVLLSGFHGRVSHGLAMVGMLIACGQRSGFREVNLVKLLELPDWGSLYHDADF